MKNRITNFLHRKLVSCVSPKNLSISVCSHVRFINFPVFMRTNMKNNCVFVYFPGVIDMKLICKTYFFQFWHVHFFGLQFLIYWNHMEKYYWLWSDSIWCVILNIKGEKYGKQLLIATLFRLRLTFWVWMEVTWQFQYILIKSQYKLLQNLFNLIRKIYSSTKNNDKLKICI